MAETVGQLDIAISFNTKSMDKGLEEVEQKASKTGQVIQTAMGMLAANAVQGTISKVGDLAKSVIEIGSSFESSMSEVAAISGATGADLELLEKTAREFGASTQFSATEASQALKYMSLAGWDANQSASALGGVLDLAAASGMDLAQASDMVTDYLSAFGMEASESTYFADLLSYAQAKSNTTAEALGEAYKNCAANLNAAGQDVETTTSLLAMMADQGLKGSEAGTALNAVMRDMTAKMKDGAIAIGDTQVQVMDANGNYRDMTDILMDVQSATAGMGDAERAAALASTFTSDSIKGLNLIMNAGVNKAAAFEEALRSSDGTASNMADAMNDNLNGRLRELTSKLAEVALKIYDVIQPALEVGVQLVGGFADAVGWAIDNADWLLPVLGALTAGFVAYEVAVNGAAIAQGIATTATNVMAAAQAALNVVMSLNPIGVIVAAIAALVVGLVLLWKNCEGFRNFIGGMFESIGQFVGFLGEQISGFFNGIVEWLTNLPENISAFINTVITFFMELPANLQAFFTSILVNVATWIGEMVGKAIELGGQFLSAIGQFFSQLPYNIGMFLATALLTIGQFVVDAIAKAIELGTQFLQNVIDFFIQLPTNIWNFLTEAFNFVVTWVSDMIAKAIEIGTQFLQNIISFFTQLPGRIWNFLVQTINNVVNFAKDFVAKAVQAGKDFFDGIVDKVTEIPGKMLEIGKNIVEGIWNGISGAAGWLWDQISGFCSGIVDGIKSFFGINSPSTLFRDDVGVFLAQGIGVGFEEEMKSVSKEMADSLPTTAIDGVDSWISSVETLFVEEDDNMAGTDTPEAVNINQTNNIYSAFDFEQINEELLQEIRRAA